MTIFIVIAPHEPNTYGAFYTEEEAKERIAALYSNGFFGELEIMEDEIRS